MLCRCRLLGFVLYWGVLNTATISHELDRNYCPFKTSFRCIMGIAVQNRIAKGELTSLPLWIVGLVVFGGKDPVMDMDVHRNAFEDAFGLESNLNTWGKVGTAPCT